MIRMRMIEADNVQALVTGQALRPDYLKGIKAIVARWLRVGIVARIDRTYGSVVVRQTTEQDPTAFLRITSLSMFPDQIVIRLVNLQHLSIHKTNILEFLESDRKCYE
jgi:hypothetical protein